MDEELHARRRVALLAADQGGVVSRRQLSALGIERGAVEKWVRGKRLHRVHRGVYAVGHTALGPKGRMMVAVLAAGSGAVLSHRSSAAWLGLRRSARAQIDVTVPGRGGRRKLRGIDIHTGALTAADITTHDGVPVTTVARTLVDLAAVVDAEGLRRAAEQAQIAHLFDARALAQAMTRAGRRRGIKALRATLAELEDDPPITRSELEQRFRALCNRARLPPPILNAQIPTDVRTYEVDAHWPQHNLVVELDGWETHRTRAAFERDRRKDAALARAGQRVVRLTWRLVVCDPDEVAATLAAALTRPSPPRRRSAA